MIEINLLPGKKAKKAAGARFKLSLPDFRNLLSTIKDPYLIAAVAAAGVAGGGGGALFVLGQATIPGPAHRLQTVQAPKTPFGIFIAPKRQNGIARHSP